MHRMLLRQTYLKSDALSGNESEVKCLADDRTAMARLGGDLHRLSMG